MALFQTREPRKYNRISIYTSERKEKLDKLVKDVKREMGELPADEIEPDHFKGKFSQFTPHAQNSGEKGHRLTWPVVLLLVVGLILLWRYIVMGKL